MLSFWGLVQFLFLVCFFCTFLNEIDIDYQRLASSQQILKKYIMMRLFFAWVYKYSENEEQFDGIIANFAPFFWQNDVCLRNTQL